MSQRFNADLATLRKMYAHLYAAVNVLVGAEEIWAPGGYAYSKNMWKEIQIDARRKMIVIANEIHSFENRYPSFLQDIRVINIRTGYYWRGNPKVKEMAIEVMETTNFDF